MYVKEGVGLYYLSRSLLGWKVLDVNNDSNIGLGSLLYANFKIHELEPDFQVRMLMLVLLLLFIVLGCVIGF